MGPIGSTGSFFSFAQGGIEDSPNYEKVKVKEINRSSDAVTLKDTTVNGGVFVKSLNAVDSQASEVIATNNIDLTRTRIWGDVESSEGNIQALNCQSLGSLSAPEGSIVANDCLELASVSAKGQVTLKTCPKVNGVKTIGGVILHDTMVAFSVAAEGSIELIRSKMNELRMVVSPLLPSPVIKNCTINTVSIKRNKSITNSVGLTSTQIGVVKGDHITAQMFLKEGSIHYGDHLEAKPRTFEVSDEGKMHELVPSTNKMKKIVITLTDSKVKKVVFEDGIEGEVILAGTSSVTKISGGAARTGSKVETKNNEI